jgi:hypothetical protein
MSVFALYWIIDSGSAGSFSYKLCGLCALTKTEGGCVTIAIEEGMDVRDIDHSRIG